jgi:branched-chain amino acid transport system permease protein
VRTEGIYTIMITLAIARPSSTSPGRTTASSTAIPASTSWCRRSCSAWTGASRAVLLPDARLRGALLRLAVVYVSRSPFGLALQGVRDNPRRMAALGFNVTAHRIAAYTFASVIAAVGGILLVWQNAQIAPGHGRHSAVIDILVIAVVGGCAGRSARSSAPSSTCCCAPSRPDVLGLRPVGRALQAADRARLPGDRVLLARRRARPVGPLARPARRKARDPLTGGRCMP